jgi:hypothetical protein
VSASQGLGATTGILRLGDERRHIELSYDPAQLSVMPMILYKERRGQWLLRVFFSLGEIDETRRLDEEREQFTEHHRSILPGWDSGEGLTFAFDIEAKESPR